MRRTGRRVVATAVALASLAGCAVPVGYGRNVGPADVFRVAAERRQGPDGSVLAGRGGAGGVPEGMSGLVVIPMLAAAVVTLAVVTIAVGASKRRD